MANATFVTFIILFILVLFLQVERPISMKKEGIQTRNRKISTKCKNKKRNPQEPQFYDMIKPQPTPYGDMKFHIPTAHAYIPAATQPAYSTPFLFHAQ